MKYNGVFPVPSLCLVADLSIRVARSNWKMDGVTVSPLSVVCRTTFSCVIQRRLVAALPFTDRNSELLSVLRVAKS